MMKDPVRSAVLIAFVLLAIALPAWTEEAGVTQSRTALDAIAADIEKLPSGDVAAASAVIERINAVKTQLSACTDHRAKEWGEQAKRANSLDLKTRDIAKGRGGAGGEAKADSPTLEAVAKLAEVEDALASLPSGDVDAGNLLIGKINDCRTLLGKSSLRSTKEWKESAERAKTLDQRVRARIKGEDAPRTADSPPTGGPPLGRDDGYIFRTRFEQVFRGCESDLARFGPTALADDWRAGQLQDAIARMRGDLKRISDQQHPLVKWAGDRLDKLASAVAGKVAEGKSLVAAEHEKSVQEAGDVDAQLTQLEVFFDTKTFRCDLEPPFSTERLRLWNAKRREYENMEGQGAKQLDALSQEHPKYAEDPRVQRLRFVFKEFLPQKITQAVSAATGEIQHRLELARALLAPDALTAEHLANEHWVANAIESTRNGIEAAEAAALLTDQPPSPESAKLAQELRALEQRIDAGTKSLVAATRMPKARSTSAELLKIANDTLADPSYGAGASKRMVVNADKEHRKEARAEARLDNGKIFVRSWTEEWDHFQVCRAEEVDGDLRLVYYSLKFMQQGPSWMPVNRWYVQDRIVGARILPENVDQ